MQTPVKCLILQARLTKMEKYCILNKEKRELEKKLESVTCELNSSREHLEKHDCIALSIYNRQHNLDPCHVPNHQLKALQKALLEAGLSAIKTIPRGYGSYEYHDDTLRTKCQCVSFDPCADAPSLDTSKRVGYRCDFCVAKGVNEIGSIYKEEVIPITTTQKIDQEASSITLESAISSGDFMKKYPGFVLPRGLYKVTCSMTTNTP